MIASSIHLGGTIVKQAPRPLLVVEQAEPFLRFGRHRKGHGARQCDHPRVAGRSSANHVRFILVPVPHAQQRPRVSSGISNQQQPAGLGGHVRSGGVHGADMVERHGPCGTNAFLGAGGVHGIGIQVDRAAEVPGIGVVVIVDLALVRAWQAQQGPVNTGDIVQEHAYRQERVVGVRIKAPILVPLDGRTDPARLQVDFGVVHSNVRADQLLQTIDKGGMSYELPEEVEVPVWHLDAANGGLFRSVGRLELEGRRRACQR